MRNGWALAVVVLAALALPLGPGARGLAGAPTCSNVESAAGDVGSFLRLKTCSAYFAGSDRYRPARYRLVSGSLPPGLSLWGDGEPAAQIDGTPKKAGVYRFTVAATDALGGRATGTYTVEIHPRLVLAGGALGASAVIGAPYRAQVSAAGGRPPYTYGAFSLNGLTLDRTTGVLSGTIESGRGTPALVCPFRLSVTDSTGATTSALYRVGVYDASGNGPLLASCSVQFNGLGLTWVQGINPTRGPVPAGLLTPRSLVEIVPVTIRGRGLSNVTRVQFAGRRAVFEVDSDRRITAIPPRGATTGSITLTTSDGRIRDAGVYRVFFGG